MHQKQSFYFSLRTLFLTIAMAALASSTTASELKVDVVSVGVGEQAENGMQISVHYEGRLNDGTVLCCQTNENSHRIACAA